MTTPHQTSKGKYTVYWIRHPLHTDMFSEGYIGITSKSLKERLRGHLDATKRHYGSSKQTVVGRALLKYGQDTLVMEAICYCDKEYAQYLEREMRPEKKIGWNIAIGGDIPPGVKGLPVSKETREKLSKVHKGKLVSEETRQKQSKAKKGIPLAPNHAEKVRKNLLKNAFVWTDEAKAKLRLRMSALHKGRVLSEDHKLKLSVSLTGRKIAHSHDLWRNPKASKELWLISDSIYELWSSGLTEKEIKEALSIPKNKHICKMLENFEKGFNPTLDEQWCMWCEDFRSHNAKQAN